MMAVAPAGREFILVSRSRDRPPMTQVTSGSPRVADPSFTTYPLLVVRLGTLGKEVLVLRSGLAAKACPLHTLLPARPKENGKASGLEP